MKEILSGESSSSAHSPLESFENSKKSCPLTGEGLGTYLSLPQDLQKLYEKFKLSDKSKGDNNKEEGDDGGKVYNNLQEYFEDHREEYEPLRCELITLQNNTNDFINVMNDKIGSLRLWIKESFGVDDVHAWLEMNPPPVISKTDSDNTNSRRSDSLVSDGGGKTEDTKPILRIKLVDEKLKQVASGALSPTQARGTGSKNLSRMMSKPSDGEGRVKVANQTPVNVFWNYVEPFFRPIDENELRVLEETIKFTDPAPFVIPPLGKHYSEHWREQYGYQCHQRSVRKRFSNVTMDEKLYEAPRASTLRERLLAMMIEENLAVPETNGGGSGGESSGNSSLNEQGDLDSLGETSSGLSSVNGHSISNINNISKNIDYKSVDERIRVELSQSGLQMFVPKYDYQEDDPICCEMRILQRKLREQVCLNRYRKRKLADLLREKLPAQEYYSLLQEIDKQIEQVYLKRSKSNPMKSKKKKASTGGAGATGGGISPSPSPSPAVSNEGIALIDTRRKLIEAFAQLMPSLTTFLSGHPSSDERLYDAQVEGKVLEYARLNGTWLPIPDQPLQHTRLSTHPTHPVFPAISTTFHNRSEKDEAVIFEHPSIMP